MNFRSLLTLVLWAIIAWLLFRACSPTSDAPRELATSTRVEDFTDRSDEAQTIVLENALVWSEWSTEGAGCLEIKLKEFTPSKVTDHEPDEDDWLVLFRAQRGMPPGTNQEPRPVHYRDRLGLRLYQSEAAVDAHLDAVLWQLEARPENNELVFRYQSAEGVRFVKRVRLPEDRYHFDVDVAAEAGSEEFQARDIPLRLATGGGIVREPDSFYPNPYAAVGLIKNGALDDFDQYFPKGELPNDARRDAVSRWRGEVGYVVEGSKYFLSALRPINRDFRGAVAEALYDDRARERDILSAFSQQDRARVQAIGRAEQELAAEAGEKPSNAAIAAHLGLEETDVRALRSQLQGRIQQVSMRNGSWIESPYWKRTSVAGDFTLHLGRPGDPADRAEFQWYVGPKDKGMLADYGLLRTIPDEADYGSSFFYKMFLTQWVAPLIMTLLNIFHSVVGNWGVAIILLTVLVRGLLMPLNRRSQLKMAEYQQKMQKVKPLLDKINKKYGKDPRKKQEETMKLYRQHSVTPPLGGCLPILLQMPIFIGLFAALRSATDLRQQPFMGWIQDLSRPDALIDFGAPLAGFFPLSAVTSFNLLPVIMVVLWVAHQKSMPKPADPNAAQMQKIMTFMPILFGIMLYNYAAGLSLYMITSSAIGIFEAKIIKKKWPVAVPGQPSEPVTG